MSRKLICDKCYEARLKNVMEKNETERNETKFILSTELNETKFDLSTV